MTELLICKIRVIKLLLKSHVMDEATSLLTTKMDRNFGLT